MPWTRRRSKRPFFGLLLILLVATLAAPWTWAWIRARRTVADSGASGPLTLNAAASPRVPARRPVTPPTPQRSIRGERSHSAEAAVELPPLAVGPATLGDAAPRNLAVAEPSLAAARTASVAAASSAVGFDDYAVVLEETTSVQPSADRGDVPSRTGPTAGGDAESSPAESARNFAVPLQKRPIVHVQVGSPEERLAMVVPRESPFTLAGESQLSCNSEPINLTEPVVEFVAQARSPEQTQFIRREPPADLLAKISAGAADLQQLLHSPSPPDELALTADSHVSSGGDTPRGFLAGPPRALTSQLQTLSTGSGPAAVWANSALEQVAVLTHSHEEASVKGALGVLRTLVQRGLNDALQVASGERQSAWIRASLALHRRVDVWESLADPATRAAYDSTFGAQADRSVAEAVAAVAALVGDDLAEGAWRKYLRLDDLAALAGESGQAQPAARRRVAFDVVARLRAPELSPRQRQFVAQSPVSDLGTSLEAWTVGSPTLAQLAAQIERFEERGRSEDARTIAAVCRRLASQENRDLRALGDNLQRHYRNANVRVAFSRELLSRMIPPGQMRSERIHDKIAGAEVRGQSSTSTDVRLRLEPGANGWRFAIVAEGDVRSQTQSQTWPARVRNASRLRYEATKIIAIDRQGLHISPATARAEGRTDLVGVDSSLEPVPLLGSLIESAARARHRERRPLALAQVKSKVARQAQERMDQEADPKLRKLEQRVTTAVSEPLTRLGIAVEPVEMSTTQQRAVMRLRLADDAQLAACTPRPTAPADSLLSVQFHQSALNNSLAGLELDGRRMTVGELHYLLGEKIIRRAATPAADVPQHAVVEFAPQDALRIVCHQDRFELIIRLVELRKGRDSIRNVEAHAFFKPALDGLQVKLVRDGALQFEGAHLRTGPRMVLHSVFGKLIRKDQEIPLLTAPIEADPRLDGLMITQLVIDDGWIAASVGPATPQRAAWRSRDAAASTVR